MTTRTAVHGADLTIDSGDTFMVSDPGGAIAVDASQGVFAGDTRFVSSYALWVNGRRWERVSSAPVSYNHARVYLTNPELPQTDTAPLIPEGTLGLTIDRAVDVGVHKQFEEVNYSGRSVRLLVEIEVQSDFADLVVAAGQHGRPAEGALRVARLRLRGKVRHGRDL